MRKSFRGLSVFAALLLLLTAVAFGQAQEATQEASTTGAQVGSPITCNSDVIANLYIAQRDFGFGPLHDQLMQSGTTSVDLTQIDKGPFTPLFNNIPTTTSDLTTDQMNAVSSLMMDSTALQDQLASLAPAGSTPQLNAPTVVGEPAECTTLRTELSNFFTAVALQDLGTNVTPNTEATAEAGVSTTTTGSTRENVSFSTTLSGAAEIPGPGDPDGTGTVAITVDFANSQVCYNVTVQNLTLPATAMHIHPGAIGESGAPVVPFDKAPDASGNATGCVIVSDTNLLNQIADNPAGFYINVHTSDYPDGAARGQVAG